MDNRTRAREWGKRWALTSETCDDLAALLDSVPREVMEETVRWLRARCDASPTGAILIRASDVNALATPTKPGDETK